MVTQRRWFCAVAFLTGCVGGGLPDGWRDTPNGTGASIVWDINADPLPELPLPNDVATWADPSSPTGLRLNVSQISPTRFERITRGGFDELDGWGTYAAVTIPFDEHIDTRDLFEKQGGDSSAFSERRFQRHAVYLIDLETGLPTPLSVNSGNFQYILDRTSPMWDHDPHAGESNLIFETHDEDTNRNGVLDVGEDLDYDGVLDVPNTWDGTIANEMSTIDEMTWFYERETKTLMLRPILPMKPATKHAVVVTDRLLDISGESVRSPFPQVHHVSQKTQLASLPDIFAAHPEIYGDLANRGWDGVAFAWSFTTQTTTDDLTAIRDGMYGRGTLSHIHDAFPNDFAPAVLRDPAGVRCPDPEDELFMASGEAFGRAMGQIAPLAFGLSPEQTEEMVRSYDSMDYFVSGYFDTPYFLGDPKQVGLEDKFKVNRQTGEARVDRETVNFVAFVPKETAEHKQPFPVGFYVHGYGSSAPEPLPVIGYLLQHGMTVVVLNAEGHGATVDGASLGIIRNLFRQECIAPGIDVVLDSRAEDITGNGSVDSGADFWTAYLFHTRDVVRQSVIDYMRALQIIRSFDGRVANPISFEDGPGENAIEYDAKQFRDTGDIAGDFDNNGIPDFGGPENNYFFTGGSLGGIVAGVLGGVEPSVTTLAPIVGTGGLSDAAYRSDNGGVLNGMHLRVLGPFITTTDSEGPNNGTSCPAGEVSLNFLGANANTRARVEFACVPRAELNSESVLLVQNLETKERFCGGALEGDHFRIPYASDTGDPLQVNIYQNAKGAFDFHTCLAKEPIQPSTTISDWGVGNGSGAGNCRDCAKFRKKIWAVGDLLVSPMLGLGMKRQSPDLRRMLSLAQIGLEAADPINYIHRVLLEPLTAPDTLPKQRNLLVLNSIGDQNVPINGGNAMARAAGLLPFMPVDAPRVFDAWRAPASFEAKYPGFATPNDLLIGYHVLEGVERLKRHPIEGADAFLFDVDDLSEGLFRFQADGKAQSPDPDGLTHPRLDKPLRWHRSSRQKRDPQDDAVWTQEPGRAVSGLINAYAIPNGAHGFDQLLYPDTLPFDPAQYVFNLLMRYGTTKGQDLYYLTDPDNHTCLQDSSCPFMNEVE